MSDIKNEKFRSVSDQVEVYKFRIETLEQIELFQRNEITPLISTIESQTSKIDSLLKMLDGNSETMQLQISEIEQKDTLIESQKEEIERWGKLYEQEREFSTKFQHERDEAVKRSVFWEDHCGNSELRIESLKDITELAVKGFKEIKSMEFYEGAATPEQRIAIRSLSEIERLTNGTT